MEKLRIMNADTKSAIEVLFNPSEYTFEDANVWDDQKHPGRKAGTQFAGRSLKKLSMELFFDTYEKGTDVRSETNKIAALLIPLNIKDGMRPPRCHILWGRSNDQSKDSLFEWVLESLKQQFTLFLGEGTPVRARLSVSFKEYVEPTKEEKNKGNSFPAQAHTVQQGETLAGIASELWGKPGDWRLLAAANAIDNPRLLEPGRILAVPAVR